MITSLLPISLFIPSLKTTFPLLFVFSTNFVSQVPAESVLLPISTHLVHFLNKRQPKLQARDAGIWWGTLGKLQLMLRKAARALYQNDKVNILKLFLGNFSPSKLEISIKKNIIDLFPCCFMTTQI